MATLGDMIREHEQAKLSRGVEFVCLVCGGRPRSVSVESQPMLRSITYSAKCCGKEEIGALTQTQINRVQAGLQVEVQLFQGQAHAV